MSLPQPPVALKDHCSVIQDDTLFTYQHDAFQSLPLKDGATWSKLPMGVPTKFSTCVAGTSNGEKSLFVVGGSTDEAQSKYSGMQRYSLNTKKWETWNPVSQVAKNRIQHGSAFLSQSSSILIYGGSQDGVQDLPSSQTFLVSTTPPFSVQAFNSVAPPVVNPLMMPWNTSHALMLGGDPQNTDLFTFGPEVGWRQLDVNLKQGLPNANQVQASIMDGSDGSKLLEIFNMNTSPNQISTVLLQQPTSTSGSGQSTGSQTSSNPSSSSSTSSRKRKRGTLADRPAYNSTLAPQQTRNGFSLAQDPQTGLIVASGGNSQDVICMFNQTGNQWIDASQFFGVSKQDVSTTPTSVQSPASSLTGAPPPPSNPPTDGGPNTTHHSLTILGATLGAIFGVAALLLLLLLLLRCMRRRKERKHSGQHGVYSLDDKHDMDFMDRGDDDMRQAAGSFGHKHAHSGNSSASPAVAHSRAGSAQSKRGFLHKADGSGGSSKSLFSKKSNHSPPVISEPIMQPPPGQRNFSSQPMQSPEPRTDPRADGGWSKYWAHNSKDNLGSNGLNRHESAASHPTAYTSGSHSDYATSASTNPHESAEVEPLNIRSSQIPSSERVVSPTSGLPLPGLALSHSNHGVVGPEPISPSTMVSDIDEEDEYRLDQHPSHEGQDSWTPVQTSDRASSWTDPRVSSVYADSMIYPHPGERVRIPNFPGVPGSRRPSNNSGSNGERGMRSTAARDFGRGNPSRNLDEAQYLPPSTTQREREYTERQRMERLEPYRLQADTAVRNQQPEARTFPRRPEELGPRGRGGVETEDMSWLNLGR
ncbi:MAG: hypothetical protein LQ350_005454 [Teloschistes chrysophthalmus]|nr:MAG: hypothetical protein LQ350_005454 [Niorma chrysophthalma]